MDPNLTYPIVLNATLNQPPQNLLANPAIYTTLGVVIGWLLNFATSTIQEKRRYRIDRLQRQEQAYSQLRGLQMMTDQLYMSAIGVSIIFSMINARKRLKLQSRSDLGPIEEKHREYNKLDLEIARNNQQLWETIGLIQIRFSPSNKLEKLIEPFGPSVMRLCEYRKSINDYYMEVNVENIDSCPYNGTWPNDVIYENVTVPFEALQEYLKAEIDKGQETFSSKIKNWLYTTNNQFFLIALLSGI